MSGDRLAASELAGLVAGAVLVVSLPAFDWFAFSDREQTVVGSEGDAFRWLDGPEYLLLAAGLVAVAAPLLRLAGLVSATPRDVAVVTASAGLIGAVVIAALIASPPDLDRGFLNVPVGGGPTAHTIVEGGSVVALISAIAIVAASVLTLVASPAALAPARRPAPVAPAPQPAPTPKRSAKPKPVATPAPAPKTSARPRLATATADDLIGIGFTQTQAERIVEHRDELGKVTKVSDLRRVPGIAKPVLVELVKRLDE